MKLHPRKDHPMTTTETNVRTRFTVLLAVVVLIAATAAHGAKRDASKSQPKPPQWKMLFKIFAPIMQDIGSCNLQKASVVSGPVEMKMANNKKPGKQWRVRLGQSEFKVTIEDSANLKLKTALSYAERIPVAYRRALEVVSEGQKAGLAFYKTLGGAAAHGGQSYLNMIPLKVDRAASVIVHETGHILEQRARSKEKDILDRWAQAVKSDKIDVSRYGRNANHEDQAEFARLYAFCIDYAAGRNMKNELKKLSPKRFELWEHILRTAKALPTLHLDVEFNPLGGPLRDGKGNSDKAKVKIISGPTKVQMRQYDRSKNKVVTIEAKQWLASLGEAKFKITFEDTEMKLKLKDAIKLVETLPPAYRVGLVATSEKKETGLTIYKGGCAYGVPDRIGMGGHNLSASTIAHECGHTVDQKARESDKDIMSKWGLAKIRDAVSVSGYGNGPIHEDQAEFARLYAISLAHSPKYLAKLKSLAPTRYALWERMLVLTGGMDAKDAAAALDFDFNVELKKHAELREKMAPKLKKVMETIKG
jgi:hypothetical protein